MEYNDPKNAERYTDCPLENTHSLAYRDIPQLVAKYAAGMRAIDYGCGTGRSTRFIKNLGFETLGVDINEEMVKQATQIDISTHYLLIKNAEIPVIAGSCDLIFACLVVCTIFNKKELNAMFKEIHRCLKENGIFIFVTASDIFYSHQWLSYKTDYQENQNPKSGDPVKFFLKEIELELVNCYWSDIDYSNFSETNGFKIEEKIFPLGKVNDNEGWVSEMEHPPYAIYVLRKLTK